MIESLREWIATTYREYTVERVPLEGTYGQVWLLNRPDQPTMALALKAPHPKVLGKKAPEEVRQLFERELRQWLALPSHLNVVTAFALQFARVDHGFGGAWSALPLVPMRRCDGSLKDWIGEPRVDLIDKLLALVQTCNGLAWLYDHGIQGHGDIKPDNILFRRMPWAPEMEPTVFPSPAHPYLVTVSDLGWADAWLELGKFTTTYRPYLAPERLRHTFVPELSDVFSLGVVACELLTGHHPAGKPTERVATKLNTDKLWLEWATGSHSVDVEPPELGAVIDQCLEPDPSRRPSVAEVSNVICEFLDKGFGVRAQPTLELWTTTAREAGSTRRSWGLKEAAKASPAALDEAISKLESHPELVELASTPLEVRDGFEWSRSLIELLLRRGNGADVVRAEYIAKSIFEYAIGHFDHWDLRAIEGMTPKSGPDDRVGFEAWEPMSDYARIAVRFLRHIKGKESGMLRDFEEQLLAKQRWSGMGGWSYPLNDEERRAHIEGLFLNRGRRGDEDDRA